jgi:SAM-dependent methyltransferase
VTTRAPLRAALIRRVGHRPLLYVRSVRDRRRDRRGHCSVCGATTTFVFNSWVVADDMRREWESRGAGDRLVERETMYCRRCLASLRVRRIADVLVLHYAEQARSVAEMLGEATFWSLDVAEINSAGALHSVLERHPRMRYSEFRENAELGEVVGGVRHEDICRLTYPDASLDLVLTADTLEHVPDFRDALREIRRVLRPGGRHVFTVPVSAARRQTLTRASRDDADRIVFHAPPQYHGRGSGPLALLSPRRTDFLAYHDFGLDLLEDLSAAGYRPEVHFYRESDPGSAAFLVFCAEAA